MSELNKQIQFDYLRQTYRETLKKIRKAYTIKINIEKRIEELQKRLEFVQLKSSKQLIEVRISTYTGVYLMYHNYIISKQMKLRKIYRAINNIIETTEYGTLN